jgi:hypothetical protein
MNEIVCVSQAGGNAEEQDDTGGGHGGNDGMPRLAECAEVFH